MKKILLLAVVALFSVACGDGSTGGDNVEGSWQMTTGTVDGEEIPILEDHPITIVFEGGEVSGTAACNGYGGTFELSGSTIAISDLVMTEMGCFPQEVMVAEAMFADGITRVDTFSVDGRLTLMGEGVEMVFDVLEPVPDADLTNTVWVLDGLVTGDSISTPVLDTRATLEFFTDGSVLGDTGCRPFSGHYSISGGEVAISDLASDGHECEPDLADQDGLVSSVLGDGFTVEIDASRLTVSSGGQGLVYLAETSGGPDPTTSTSPECDPVTDLAGDDASAEKLHLWVSNQSFDIDPASIEINIDERAVVCDLFFVEGQHNWILFDLMMEPGEHELSAVRADGTAELTEVFEISHERWAVVDFWFYPDEGPEHFTFSIHDEPVAFD